MGQETISARLDEFCLLNGEAPKKSEPIQAEGSIRKFTRIYYSTTTYILCEDPNFDSLPNDFLEVSKFLEKYEIAASRFIKYDTSLQAILLSDEGTLDLTSIKNDDTYYQKLVECMDILLKLQTLRPLEFIRIRKFDFPKLNYEIEFTVEAFQKFKERFSLLTSVSAEMLEFLEQILRYLSLYENKVVCHRDFHSRNLLLNKEGKISLIDYQDAMMGTPHYDLVSLLYDAYRPLPLKNRLLCYNYYKEKSSHRNMRFKEHFYTQALQRSFKALGFYLFSVSEKGKAKYKESILNCLDNLEEIIQLGYFPDSLFVFIHLLREEIKVSEKFNSF